MSLLVETWGANWLNLTLLEKLSEYLITLRLFNRSDARFDPPMVSLETDRLEYFVFIVHL